MCFKLLGHCNRFTFLFFIFHDFLYVLIYLIDHVYISLAFDFWPFGGGGGDTVFSIWFLASAFLHIVL